MQTFCVCIAYAYLRLYYPIYADMLVRFRKSSYRMIRTQSSNTIWFTSPLLVFFVHFIWPHVQCACSNIFLDFYYRLERWQAGVTAFFLKHKMTCLAAFTRMIHIYVCMQIADPCLHNRYRNHVGHFFFWFKFCSKVNWKRRFVGSRDEKLGIRIFRSF